MTEKQLYSLEVAIDMMKNENSIMGLVGEDDFCYYFWSGIDDCFCFYDKNTNHTTIDIILPKGNYYIYENNETQFEKDIKQFDIFIGENKDPTLSIGENGIKINDNNGGSIEIPPKKLTEYPKVKAPQRLEYEDKIASVIFEMKNIPLKIRLEYIEKIIK